MKCKPSNGPLIGEVELPISKSIANRYLIITALANQPIKLPEGLPEDVDVLKHALQSESNQINIGMAGTAMRFLTGYYAVQVGKQVVLTGDERMKQRPISELVNALRELGAEISYVEKDGFPPLKISGMKLKGGEVCISGEVSSQFISALMMIGPTLKNGLKINLNGEILSGPYLELTAKCMVECGAQIEMKENKITIHPSKYLISNLKIESDWSAASYFYALACAKPNSKLLLKGLKLNSNQGDSILAEWFKPLGVTSKQMGNGVEISSSGIIDFPSEMDFKNNPDLAQTFAFLAAALGNNLKLTGLNNLRLKETDRIAALQTELEKLGLDVATNDNSLQIDGNLAVDSAYIQTYKDHRMAMSAAVLSTVLEVEIENPKVVDKSFPGFWNELK